MDYLKEFETSLAYHFSEVLEYPFVKPHWIYISLSHKCTYNCQMCGVVKILKGYELPKEAVKKALDEISQWKTDCVIMFTGGEPFLRKDIFELIEYSSGVNLKTEVVSNGALIDARLANKIISSGLRNIAISLDGRSSSTHDSIREGGSFRKACQAIKNLVEAKKGNGSGPQISVWTTIMKENLTELFDILSLVRDLGVECLVYHPVIVAQDDMQNTCPDAPFWINREDLKILKEQIDKIVDYQNKSGLVAFLHDPYLWIKYFEATLMKRDWRCNPFVFINIGPDGDVRSCGSSFGNIKQMSLNECLATEEAHKARKLMKKCKRPCLQTCWAYPQADSLAGIVENFIVNLEKSDFNGEDKKMIIAEALDMLSKYESLAKERCLS